MKKIILFTKMTSIKKHWENSLYKKHFTIHIDNINNLYEYLKNHDKDFIIMIDELSVTDIEELLNDLTRCKIDKILLFNSRPEVHHAATLLQKGIQGYENSYIAKENLLKMIPSIEDGKRWLFSDLTHFIINKYVQSMDQNEPDFIHRLTQNEKDIALMIADGLTNKEITQQKKVAISTVKGHIQHIFEKARVSSRIELALKFK